MDEAERACYHSECRKAIANRVNIEKSRGTKRDMKIQPTGRVLRAHPLQQQPPRDLKEQKFPLNRRFVYLGLALFAQAIHPVNNYYANRKN